MAASAVYLLALKASASLAAYWSAVSVLVSVPFTALPLVVYVPPYWLALVLRIEQRAAAVALLVVL